MIHQHRVMYVADHVCFPSTNGAGRVYEGWIKSLAAARIPSFVVIIERYVTWPTQNRDRLKSIAPNCEILRVDNLTLFRNRIRELLQAWQAQLLVVSLPRNMKLIGNEIIDDFTGEVVLDIHDDYVYKSYLVNRLAKETFMRTPELFATPPFHRYVEEVTKDFDLNSEYKTASEIYDNIDYVLFPTTQELCRYQSLYPEHARKFGQIEWSIEGSWRAPTPLGHAETTGASPATVRKRADICLMASQELFNFDGVHFLLRDIMPKVWNRLPGSKLIIAGAVCGMIRSDFEFADCSFANIELLPAFDDPNAIYERADIVVAPLRYGTGLSIKLVEALKAGKAIVTTSTGCRGVPLRDGQHALIRDCADDFASALIELLADTSARTELAGQAFVFGKARYSQSSLISGLDRLLAGR